ncbi:MAG: glycosyltransferase family 4 protein [Lautropia sp.]
MQQPSLPKYRLTLYQRLARIDTFDFKLYYGSEEPMLANVAPEGFAAQMVPFQAFRLTRRTTFYWHGIQWHLASPQRSDVAIFCWNARFLTLLPALLRARLSGVPTALWGHGFSKSESWLRTMLRRIPSRIADGIILYDFRTAAQWEQSGYPTDKIFVAPNGLNTMEILRIAERSRSRPQAEIDAFERRNGLVHGPVLLYIGRIYPQNRLDLAIGSLADLSTTHPNAVLVVIGAGENEGELREHAASLGVADRVKWTGALYREEEIAPWMIAADVFVYPCNVGLSLIHGFNYGLPAVVCAPAEAHNPEVWALKDGVNGIVADRQSPESIAAAVRRIVDDPDTHGRMRQAALDCCRDTYNIDAVGQTFERLIRRLADRRGRSHAALPCKVDE